MKGNPVLYKGLVLGVIFLFVGVGIQPAIGNVQYELVDDKSKYNNELIVTVETNKNCYDIGEPVEVKIFVTNIIDEDITVVFPTVQKADFWVDSGETYIWSYGKYFITLPTPLTIHSGETVEIFSEKWEQIDYEEHQVSPGWYRIQGWMVYSNTYPDIFGNSIGVTIGTKLEIGEVSSSLFNIKTEIRNIGYYNAEKINWSIKVDGENIFSGNLTKDIIQLLSIGESEYISSNIIFGFGKCKITITVKSTNSPKASKTIDGFVILFLIIVRK